jgi:hypothetical protein
MKINERGPAQALGFRCNNKAESADVGARRTRQSSGGAAAHGAGEPEKVRRGRLGHHLGR